MPPAPPPPVEPNTAQRLWSIAKVAGPAIVAVTALAISLATYENQQSANNEQHAVDQAAAIANRQHDADQVSISQQFIPQPPWTTVTVQNYSTNIVAGVEITVESAAPSHTRGRYVERTLTLGTQPIPACSVGVVNAVPVVDTIMSHIKGAYHLPVNAPPFGVDGMNFTDRYGTAWSVQSDGFLEQIRPYLYLQSVSAFVLTQYHTVGGCTSSP